MLAAAQRNFGERSVRCTVADSTELPFEDESYEGRPACKNVGTWLFFMTLG